MAPLTHCRRVMSDARAGTAIVAGLLIACGLGLVLGVPTSAFAAAVATPTPVANGSLDVQAWPDAGELIVVTAITVPDSVKLPTTVRIPVVTGATVQWVGEVLGGDLSADPARQYTMKTSPAGGRYAEFTLEQTRSAQVDSSVQGLTVNGSSVTAAFEWIQSVSSPVTSFAVRVPPNSSNVVVSPKPSSTPELNAGGETLYSGDPLTLSPGTRQKVTFSYVVGSASTAAAGGSVNTLIIVLLVALAIAIIALVVAVARQRQGGQAQESPASSPRPAKKTPEPVEEPERDDSNDDAWGFDVDDE